MRASCILLAGGLLAGLTAPALAEVRTGEGSSAQAGGALPLRGGYSLECWQKGTRVVADSGQGELLLPTAPAGGLLQIKRSDGGRTLFLLDGETLCRVSAKPGPGDTSR